MTHITPSPYAMNIASKYGNLEIIKFLYNETELKIGDVAVSNAITDGRFAVVEYFEFLGLVEGARIVPRDH